MDNKMLVQKGRAYLNLMRCGIDESYNIQRLEALFNEIEKLQCK